MDADPSPSKHLKEVVLLLPVAASLPRNVTLSPVQLFVNRNANLHIARSKYKSCLCFGTGIIQNNFLKK